MAAPIFGRAVGSEPRPTISSRATTASNNKSSRHRSFAQRQTLSSWAAHWEDEDGLTEQELFRGNDRLCHDRHLHALLAGTLANPRISFLLAQAHALHKDLLGPVDQGPLSQRFLQTIGFLFEHLLFMVPCHRQRNIRRQLLGR